MEIGMNERFDKDRLIDIWSSREVCAYLSHVFARHMLSMYVVSVVKKRKIEKNIYSGILYSELGANLWITAGHVIQELEDHRVSADRKIVGVSWVDNCPVGCESGIPLACDIGQLSMHFINDPDFDWGSVKIPDFNVRQLAASGAMVPVTSSMWTGREEANPEAYYLVGIPTEWIGGENLRVPGGVNAKATPTLACVPLRMIDDRQEATPEGFWKCDHGFYAEVLPCMDEQGAELASIRGTSGGPIIGLRREADGNIRYWLFGIQSRWLPQSQILRATRIDEFANAIDSLSAEFAEAGGHGV